MRNGGTKTEQVALQQELLKQELLRQEVSLPSKNTHDRDAPNKTIDKTIVERAAIRATYPTAEDAVRKPERFAATSHYFVDRWLPELGPTAAAIVLYLRRCGYYNPRTGELRNEISRSQQEIGVGVGVSERTVRREFAENPCLPFFIQVLPSFEQNEKGRLHKVRSIYRVMMTDPIHPADAELVIQEGTRLAAEQAEGKEARVRVKRVKADEGLCAEEGRGGQEKSRTGQNGRYGDEDTKMPRRSGQNDLHGLEYRSGQNGRALDSDSNLITFEESTLTLNVEEGSTFVAVSEPLAEARPIPPRLRSRRTQALDKLVDSLVAELQDFGSERRHHQLLDICQERNLDELPRQALAATRKRLASEGAQGPLEKPGAYYQRILLALLEDHQVFIPKLGDGNPEEIRRIARQSLQDAAKPSRD